MSKKTPAAKPPRMTRDERKDEALKAALKLASKVGAERVSLANVAAAINVTAPLLFHIFGTKLQFVDELKRAARKAKLTLPPAAAVVRPRPSVKKKITPAQVKAIKRKEPAAKTKPVSRKPVAALLAPKTPVEKFKALPKPFEAAVQQVAKS